MMPKSPQNKSNSSIKITILGTGTSQGVPVIGCDCPVCLSNNPKDKRLRTSLLVQSQQTTVIIDTGPDFRQQLLRTNVNDIDAIILTHEHNDHIIGIDDVRPINFRHGKDIPVYAVERVQKDLRHRFEYIFAKKPYPGAPRLSLQTIDKTKPFQVGDIAFIPIESWHGRLSVLGFRIGNFAYLTDVKYFEAKEFEKLDGVQQLIISALHENEHHSHLNVQDAIHFIQKINPQEAYITHMSHRMGLHDEVNAILPPNIQLAFDEQEILLTFQV